MRNRACSYRVPPTRFRREGEELTDRGSTTTAPPPRRFGEPSPNFEGGGGRKSTPLSPSNKESAAGRDSERLVLLTGATGYVGGRLLKELEQRGERLRCMARRPDFLASRTDPETQLVEGDCFDPASLERALEGVKTAYYLVHSMGGRGDFALRDRTAAANFAAAAERCGVQRIVYLGGLGDASKPLSKHLSSRHETGDTLRSSGVPVVELRASIIIGSGSLSFELVRSLVERLPVMICPRWLRTPAQPIAIEDVLAYLVACLDLPNGSSRIYEIGGADRVGYADIMREYARQRNLRRRFLFVPVLTPRLSSLWLGLTTPFYARVGRELIDGIRHPTVVIDDAATRDFAIRPMGLQRAVERALVNEDADFAVTHWAGAVSSAVGTRSHWGGVRLGSRLFDTRSIDLDVDPATAFEPIRKIGGRNGWYYSDWLWRIRGAIDLLVGGPGLRRGRRDPDQVVVGDALDFWRVEAYEPGRRLRLAAEMRLPGRAWLEFEVEPKGSGSVLQQTAVFDPHGLAGLIYWYAVYPVHALVFRRMFDGIAARARQGAIA